MFFDPSVRQSEILARIPYHLCLRTAHLKSLTNLELGVVLMFRCLDV